VSGYDGAMFLVRVASHQLLERGRTSPTGCWVCDVLLDPLLLPPDQVVAARRPVAVERSRCVAVSGGIVDAHHVGAPKQVLKREFPHGARQARLAPDEAEHPETRDRILGRPREQLYVPARPGEEPFALGLDDLLMDPRNGILVRRFHHDALEHGTLAIPVALLPADTLEFVDELGLRWWLENREARRA
jgi:hypothetical protein